MGMRSIAVKLACIIIVGLGSVVNLASQAEPRQSSVLTLPNPAGQFGIGRVAFDWIDTNRIADNAAGPNEPNEPSELMVYVWYPSSKTGTETVGELFPGIKEIDSSPNLMDGWKSGPIFGHNWNRLLSGEIKSHARENAPIAMFPRTFPIVLFTPGAFGTCFEYTSAIEDLVSHGYVVASIEHTYETFAVALSGGRVRTLPAKAIQERYLAPMGASADESFERLAVWSRHRADVRAADLSFALDKLIQLNKASRFAKRLDLKHVGAMGHSRGGWAAILTCARDKRIRACVNLDGANNGEGLQYPGAPVPKQPILYVEVAKTVQVQNDWPPLKKLNLTGAEWTQKWHESVAQKFSTFPAGGYFVQLEAPNMEHYSFSDRLLLQAERDGSIEKEDFALRGLQLTEGLTRTFLDKYLKGKKHLSLRGNSQVVVRRYSPAN